MDAVSFLHMTLTLTKPAWEGGGGGGGGGGGEAVVCNAGGFKVKLKIKSYLN